METDPILVIEKPDFVLRLHKDLIEVDLKEGGKRYNGYKKLVF